MADGLADLCRSCGLCCDGSLFGRAGLEPEEAPRARKNGLRVVSSGRSFEQPCAALAVGRETAFSCAIYDERPRACRRFACRLCDRYAREGGPIGPYLASVERVRALIARAPTLGEDERRELMDAIESDFARV